MTYYREKYGYDAALHPAAARLSDRSVALPVGPHVTPEEATHIAEVTRATIEEMDA
jgi:dTDP-4-amino-4,6-dideoxygalactose transaminase